MNVYYEHACKLFVIGRNLLETIILPVNIACLDGFYFIPRKMSWVRWKIKGSWFGLADSASCVTRNVCSHRFWFWSEWKFDNRLCILLFLNIITHEKPTPSASVVTGYEGRWYILSFVLYYVTLCYVILYSRPKSSHKYCASHEWVSRFINIIAVRWKDSYHSSIFSTIVLVKSITMDNSMDRKKSLVGCTPWGCKELDAMSDWAYITITIYVIPLTTLKFIIFLLSIFYSTE